MSADEVRLTCPACHGDKFYHNQRTGFFFCHRASCHYKGRKLVGRNNTWVCSSETPSVDKEQTPKPDTWGLSTMEYDYLVKRGVHPDLISKMPIYATDQGILFDFVGWDYWQVRRYKTFGNPRWVLPHNTITNKKDGVSYEVESLNFDTKDTVVVVEGIIDALVVGKEYSAAAVLGGIVHERQLEQLQKRYKSFVYMPDGDVPKDRIAAEFMKFPKGSRLITLPNGKDPADMGSRWVRKAVEK